MAQKRAMIAERDQLRADAERILNLPENRTTRDQSQFLNELIERKAFSWTRVLENLEKVMPPRVHLVSISPQLDDDNQLALKMTVAGDSRDRAIELARRMEESRRFAQTKIISEPFLQGTKGDTEQFEIAAIYIPEPLAAGASAPKSEAKPKTELKSGLTQNPRAGCSLARRRRKETNTNAGPAANPEESQDRIGRSGGHRPAGGDRLFLAAGGLGRNAAPGNEPTADRIDHEDAPGRAAEGSPEEGCHGCQQIADFYKKRFPSQDSQILTEFGKVAAANGVKIDQGKYKLKEAKWAAATGGGRSDLAGNYARSRTSSTRSNATKCSSSLIA